MGIWDVLSALPSQESGVCLQCLQWKNTFLLVTATWKESKRTCSNLGELAKVLVS